MTQASGLISFTLFLAGAVSWGAPVSGRYIVELATEPVAVHMGRGRQAEAATHRTRVRAEQSLLRQRMERANHQVLDSVENVANALIVDSAATAEELAALPGVKRVYRVQTFHRSLDRAVALHKIADAWNTLGYDNAGQGVKVAIIDTGIDFTHAGFQDNSMTPPGGFPRYNNFSDISYTNGKIIVARSYVSLLGSRRDPDTSARDHVGHGTALAMIVGGVRTAAPLATIAGAAPKAYLGNYKIFGTPGYNDDTNDAAIVKAIDDAVADGMDIINLSLGSDFATRLEDDITVTAVERAHAAGVVVVASAGNNGPDLTTIGTPATAPSAIAVGATTNDRTFSASAELSGLSTVLAYPGTGPAPSYTVTGVLADAGQACEVLPEASLLNRIALILRGNCTFEAKLTNAKAAGAVGALVYAAADSPDPITMSVGSATLPAEMIGYDDGMAFKQALAAQPALTATLRFSTAYVATAANRLAGFSSAGPNVNNGIKPDMVATGANFYTATQKLDSAGDMYSADGFTLVDGTSFSSPLVAGAVAVVKSARPGLTADQYRSLIVNSAAAAQTRTGAAVPAQQAGAGLLDAAAALRSTATAYPTSIGFGAGAPGTALSGAIALTNIGAYNETFTIAVNPLTGGGAPAVGTPSIELAPGAVANIALTWDTTGVPAGAAEGVVAITAASTGNAIRVPYWFAATNATPARIAVLDKISSATRGSYQKDAILFRVIESSGAIVNSVKPTVTTNCGATLRGITSYDEEYPGLYGAHLQMGAAVESCTVRVGAGDAFAEIGISSR